MNDTHEVRELQYRITQLGKQAGRQGETIHRLRAELAETRELNSKIDRGQIRALENKVFSQAAVIEKQKAELAHQDEYIAELREKLAAATAVQ